MSQLQHYYWVCCQCTEYNNLPPDPNSNSPDFLYVAPTCMGGLRCKDKTLSNGQTTDNDAHEPCSSCCIAKKGDILGRVREPKGRKPLLKNYKYFYSKAIFRTEAESFHPVIHRVIDPGLETQFARSQRVNEEQVAAQISEAIRQREQRANSKRKADAEIERKKRKKLEKPEMSQEDKRLQLKNGKIVSWKCHKCGFEKNRVGHNHTKPGRYQDGPISCGYPKGTCGRGKHLICRACSFIIKTDMNSAPLEIKVTDRRAQQLLGPDYTYFLAAAMKRGNQEEAEASSQPTEKAEGSGGRTENPSDLSGRHHRAHNLSAYEEEFNALNTFPEVPIPNPQGQTYPEDNIYDDYDDDPLPGAHPPYQPFKKDSNYKRGRKVDLAVRNRRGSSSDTQPTSTRSVQVASRGIVTSSSNLHATLFRASKVADKHAARSDRPEPPDQTTKPLPTSVGRQGSEEPGIIGLGVSAILSRAQPIPHQVTPKDGKHTAPVSQVQTTGHRPSISTPIKASLTQSPSRPGTPNNSHKHPSSISNPASKRDTTTPTRPGTPSGSRALLNSISNSGPSKAPTSSTTVSQAPGRSSSTSATVKASTVQPPSRPGTPTGSRTSNITSTSSAFPKVASQLTSNSRPIPAAASKKPDQSTVKAMKPQDSSSQTTSKTSAPLARPFSALSCSLSPAPDKRLKTGETKDLASSGNKSLKPPPLKNETKGPSSSSGTTKKTDKRGSTPSSSTTKKPDKSSGTPGKPGKPGSSDKPKK